MSAAPYNGVFLAPESIVIVPGFTVPASSAFLEVPAPSCGARCSPRGVESGLASSLSES